MESWLVILMFVMGFLIIIGINLLVVVKASDILSWYLFLFFIIGIVIIVLITVSKKRNSASIKFIKDTHIVI